MHMFVIRSDLVRFEVLSSRSFSLSHGLALSLGVVSLCVYLFIFLLFALYYITYSRGSLFLDYFVHIVISSFLLVGWWGGRSVDLGISFPMFASISVQFYRM